MRLLTLFLTAMVVVEGFLHQQLSVVRRSLLATDKEDDDDFSLEAFQARVEEVEQETRVGPPKIDPAKLLDTAMYGAASFGGGIFAVAAALTALGLGLYLAGSNSPLLSVVETPQVQEESFYFFQ